jgi:hypothetical protein
VRQPGIDRLLEDGVMQCSLDGWHDSTLVDGGGINETMRWSRAKEKVEHRSSHQWGNDVDYHSADACGGVSVAGSPAQEKRE